ncbi:MAG: phosphate ABC transporter ATP-binding protein [Anaerolineae bacterium]|nr:MAG: phosphate ABC transporter ATP-binding protein [Anaerolineae bacterium]
MLEPHIRIQGLNVWYGSHQVLKNITADIPARGITVIIGPSGCGKTTLLRSLNRLLEETDHVRVMGRVLLNGSDIYSPGIDVNELRTRVGLLAPKPFPLPMSIFDNVAYGPRIHGRRNSAHLAQVMERHLRAAGLWEEVQDRLRAPASRLSTGQQQRLCLARALAVEPEVLLCDEPTSALDPISAQRIEAQLQALKEGMTIVIVTHLLRQARRLADHVVFMWLGESVESGPATQVFGAPRDERTRAYLAGDIG